MVYSGDRVVLAIDAELTLNLSFTRRLQEIGLRKAASCPKYDDKQSESPDECYFAPAMGSGVRSPSCHGLWHSESDFDGECRAGRGRCP